MRIRSLTQSRRGRGEKRILRINARGAREAKDANVKMLINHEDHEGHEVFRRFLFLGYRDRK